MSIQTHSVVGLLVLTMLPSATLQVAEDVSLRIETPMPAPGWALLERQLLKSSATACELFFARDFDARGYLLCVERWGGDDGPDDAIQNVDDWPVLHALGAADSVRSLYLRAWEGHLRQYAEARTAVVPFARDGMYYVVDGRTLYPHMYGDQGWYNYTPNPYFHGAIEVYYWSMPPDDLKRVATDAWITFLQGKDPGYPERILRQELEIVRRKVQAIHEDESTSDTRLADDPMPRNPAAVEALVRLTLGGLPPKHQGEVLHCRVRYFDPEARRPGLPPDVAAKVTGLKADETTLTLVNLDPSTPQTLILQSGGYGEHTFSSVQCGGRMIWIDKPVFSIRLAPGAGSRLVFSMKRYVNSPTLTFPWDRD